MGVELIRDAVCVCPAALIHLLKRMKINRQLLVNSVWVEAQITGHVSSRTADIFGGRISFRASASGEQESPPSSSPRDPEEIIATSQKPEL